MEVKVYGRIKVATIEGTEEIGYSMKIEGVPGVHYCKTAEALEAVAAKFGAVVKK